MPSRCSPEASPTRVPIHNVSSLKAPQVQTQVESIKTLIRTGLARDTESPFPGLRSSVCGQVLRVSNASVTWVKGRRYSYTKRKSPGRAGAYAGSAMSLVIAPIGGPERLDLGHAAVAVGQFDGHQLRGGRKLLVDLGSVGNRARISHIASRQLQDFVRHRAVDADPHLADRAAIRQQMRVVDEQAVEFAKRQPARRSHVENLALIAQQRGLRIELDRKRSLHLARGIDVAQLDGCGGRVSGKLD